MVNCLDTGLFGKCLVSTASRGKRDMTFKSIPQMGDMADCVLSKSGYYKDGGKIALFCNYGC